MTRRPSRDGHLELEEEGWMEVRRLSGGESSVRLSKEDGDFQFVCCRLGDNSGGGNLRRAGGGALVKGGRVACEVLPMLLGLQALP